MITVRRWIHTSDSENEEFECNGSSSGGEDFVNGSELEQEEEMILNYNYPPLIRKPCTNDFVIVVFTSKKTEV